MSAISSTGSSSIVEIMAMLQQLYTKQADTASTATTASTTTTTATTTATATQTAAAAAAQNGTTATGFANAIDASAYDSSTPLSDDSLLTLLQTQSVSNPSTTMAEGQVSVGAFAQWFVATDTDNDNTISKSEFETARPPNITSAQADQLFDSIDTKQTGSLTADQLQQGLAAAIAAGPTLQTPKGGTNQIFNALDTDHDGVLTQAEFEKDGSSGITQAQADAVFAIFDPTGRGGVTAAQFGQALAENSFASGTSAQTTASSLPSTPADWLSAISGTEDQDNTGYLALLTQSGDTANSASLLDGSLNSLSSLQTSQQALSTIQSSNDDFTTFLSNLFPT